MNERPHLLAPSPFSLFVFVCACFQKEKRNVDQCVKSVYVLEKYDRRSLFKNCMQHYADSSSVHVKYMCECMFGRAAAAAESYLNI